MSTAKLLLMVLAWVLASVMISVATAVVVTEIFRAVGLVESGATSYTVSINAVFVIVLGALLAVPFVFRRRFTTKEPFEP